MSLRGTVVGVEVPRYRYRWFGVLQVEVEGRALRLLATGAIAQWLLPGEGVELELRGEPREGTVSFGDYELWRAGHDRVKVWPPFEREAELARRDPLSGRAVYAYRVRAREAVLEGDFEAIAELEQFHYASQKEFVATWRCERCGSSFEANARTSCPRCGADREVRLGEIKGSTPASRFLVLELLSRQPFEPRILGYVRVDPPIPRMNRRLPGGELIRDVRERVFPEGWFRPIFRLEEFLAQHEGLPFHRLQEEARRRMVRETDTAACRISRVVIHPDYRSDGLGTAAVGMALEWIRERRVPEMRRRKELVETVAQMARFNPFFERAGFRYLWDVGSRRPALFLPLTPEAERCVARFLEEDPLARRHRGRLCVSRFGRVEPLAAPVALRNVGKLFESELELEGLPRELAELLEDFGVASRRVQQRVLRGVNLQVEPGAVVAVVGASGAGKTTLLRLIVGAAWGLREERFLPTEGEVVVPDNVHAAALIPGEFEPAFEDESILEHVYRKAGDESIAVEVLSRCGISDAVLWRARFRELSTGQRERVRLASVLAERPNLLLLDEFAAHLDALTAMRVTRGLVEVARRAGMALLVSTHRQEVLRALAPDKVIAVGYGMVRERAHL